ncbi:hypothetical protein N4G62_12260 [Sphingomonas sanguinis]|uniref:Flagellar motor switch protein FliG middle domain-containing protein n=1 Tax=Sphingomonas sanguinis TaxID=33051 RepID=A0ABU5LSS5_9SPHN|nr:hypothetical protein [Sphingomonas sanguinis]MDZ7282801.1 hypothetical protein [Sphingomonas sanguinis]
MLLAEDPLALLIERLRSLSPADRCAILSRLSAPERRRVDAALHAPARGTAPSFATDIMARITAAPTDTAMTASARQVLLRVAGGAVPVEAPRRSPSLFARLGDAFRRG